MLAGIIKALEQIFVEGYYADKVLERSFKAHPKWGGRDRKIVAETVYEIVRNRLGLETLSKTFNLEKSNEISNLVFIWLEAFQSHFAYSPNPHHGKKDLILKRFSELNEWEKASIPHWLHLEMVKERGEDEWQKLSKLLNQQAPVFLRANRLKIDAQKLAEQLEKEGFSIEILGLEALRLIDRKNVFASQAFKEGFFEVQDLHSQKVIELLDPKPSELVIDACAGAGGKTLHISSRMQNKGKVIALDIVDKKLDQLKKRAKRAGAHNLEVRLIDSSKVIKRLKARADRLLLDVPCSGLGVLRRNPDTKWKLTIKRLEELKEIQSQILDEYTSMLKKNGTLVYSTCSLIPSENKGQIAKFLARNDSFQLVEEFELFPAALKGDGFYLAKLIKIKD